MQSVEQCAQQVCWVAVEKIAPRMNRAFGREDSASLNDLAASIERDGLIQPITVRPIPGGRYEIVSGNRRYLACRMIGMTHVDAIVLEASPQDSGAQELLNRLLAGKAHYLDQADMLRALHTTYGVPRDVLACQLGMTPAMVGQRVQLAGMDAETRTLLHETGMPERCALALMRLPDAELRQRIIHQAQREHLTPRDVELLVTSAQARLPTPPGAGRTITLMRDERLYLNAVRAIAAQMQEAGVRAELQETVTPSAVTLSITVPTRHRRTERYQARYRSHAAQCTS